MDELKIIATSSDEQWTMVEVKDQFFFLNMTDMDENGDPNPVTTPGGKLLRTMYRTLADRILNDLEEYGLDYMTAESIIPWQFTIVENFGHMKHEDVERMLDESFIQSYDWSYDIPGMSYLFGTEVDRQKELRDWLSKCSHMQLTAACCVGNAYHSLNLAYILAILVENYSGETLQKQFKELVPMVLAIDNYETSTGVMKIFNTFDLYYGIHVEEEGKKTERKISLLDEPDEDITEDSEVESVGEYNLSEETFIGRNYYHYTNGIRDEEQPLELKTDLSYIAEISDEKDEDFDEGIEDYLPQDCWVKRISGAKDNQEIYYIIAITLNEGEAPNITVLRDDVTREGSGLFYVPGMSMAASHYYYEINKLNYPKEVENELSKLKENRYLSRDFSFIGKKLPKAILDEGGNGGDITDHTYALSSAYRLAYMHMSITTTEEGIIEDFDYSTYQSTGSAYGDMFSRPKTLDDWYEEIVDMLLYILDLYTDGEIASII